MIIMFSSVFLLDVGLTNSQIGLVVALGGAVSAVAQPIVAAAADSSKVPLRVWIAASAAGLALVGAALLIPGLPWLLTAVFFGLLILGVQLVLPLINAIGMAAMNAGLPVSFGVARALGSFTFAVVGAVAGRVVAAAGTPAIPLLIIGFQIAIIAAALTFHFHGHSPAAPQTSPDATADAPALPPTNWRRFLVLLAGITLSMTSHVLLNNYLFQVMTFHGGGAAEMGTAMMIGAMLELPPMLAWGWLMARWSSGTLLKFAGVFFAIKALVTWLAGSVQLLYLAQSLQIFAYAVMVPATVYYVNTMMRPRDRVKGQAYMTMTSTIGSVLGSLAGGVLIDVAGVPTLLAVGTGVATIGAILTVLAAERI